jgi:hypothetical protein
MSMPERGTPDLPHPTMQAMLCADTAIREVGTNKVTLVGIFDRIFSPEFPLVWGRPISVYVRLNDAEGTYPFRLELVRVDDEQAIGRMEGQAAISGRLAASELIVNVPPGVTFERPGRYEFRLFANGRFVIGGASLNVVQQNQVQ